MEELLYRHLTHRTTEDEDKVIYAWLEASEENRRTYFEIAAVWSAHRTLTSPALDARRDAMMLRLNARIDADEGMRRDARRSHYAWRRWMTTAAAVAVAAITLAALWLAGVRMPGANRPEIYINRTDEIAAMQLGDGTQVWVQPGTELRYEVQGSAGERIVGLDGEAFFDVAHDAARPFIVETRDLVIRVLGTAFNVRSAQAGPQTEVVLERGSVQLETPEGLSLVRLHPDQMALYDGARGDLEVEEVDAAMFVTKRYDLVSMKNATIQEIIASIERNYGVRIVVGETGDTRRYDINYLRSYPLEQVIDIVEFMTGRRCEVIRGK